MTAPAQPTTQLLDLPDGFDVAGLAGLADTEAMRERINLYLPGDSTHFQSCRITNLRQKTPSCCTICYELAREIDGEQSTTFVYARAFSPSEFADACRRARQSRWAESPDRLTVTPVNDLCAILYWFPNDERLDGLRRIVVAKKLQRILYGGFAEYPPDIWRVSDRSIRLKVLRYKPERRAVLHCRFRAVRKDDTERHERFVYLGLYEHERLISLTQSLQRVQDLAKSAKRWAPAKLIGVDNANAMVICDELKGRSFRDVLAKGNSEWATAECARAIAEMHATDGTVLPKRESIGAQLAVVADYLGRTVPERRKLIQELVQRLERADALHAQGQRVLVHGDLHPGQLIPTETKVGVVDFDRVHGGNPLEDLGNLSAQLWLGPPGGRHYDDDTVFSRFITEYSRASGVDAGPRALAEWAALALFRSAAVPLGRFEPNWRQRTHEILRKAEERLP